MHGFGRTITLCAAGGVAALTLAAAPAASGLETTARALAANTGAPVIRAIDTLEYGSLPHARGSKKLDGRLAANAQYDGPGATAIQTSGLASPREGYVRVVVESRRPQSVRALVESIGGHVERSSFGLVQVAVPAGALNRLSRRPRSISCALRTCGSSTR
jgi:hypothetical protein